VQTLDDNRRLIERYYDELWNQWRFDLLDLLISPSIKFHGSVGVSVEGLDGFRGYMRLIRSAFPDFHNTVEDLVAENGLVAARLSYRGTHRGPIFGVEPTGKAIRYEGLALFRIAGGKIVEGFVLGNVVHLLAQLGIDLAARKGGS
jgi:predicted ester cyclase